VKRYVISRKPVINTHTGKLIGYTVRLSDGTSYFEQAKRVRAGSRVNYGPSWVSGR